MIIFIDVFFKRSTSHFFLNLYSIKKVYLQNTKWVYEMSMGGGKGMRISINLFILLWGWKILNPALEISCSIQLLTAYYV